MMNRANLLTKEEWPEWNINQASSPIITLEGYHIQAVFSMVHTQLETLKRIITEQNRSINELNKKDEKSGEKNAKLLTKLTEKVDKLEKELRDGETGQLVIKLTEAEDRIKYLEEQLEMKAYSKLNEQVSNNTEQLDRNTNILNELQQYMETINLHELNEKIKKYEGQIRILETEKYETHSRVMKLEDQACWYRNQADKMNEEYQKLYENNEITAREIREFRDILLNYERNRDNQTGNHPSHSSSSNNNTHNSNNPHENTKNELTPFQENIIQSELNKLTNLLSNLDHKYQILSSQFSNLDEMYSNKLEKKIDWMKSWMMKYLRDYLDQQLGGNESNNDQTDIGKIRCLVCNHVTKRIDSDTPYNKPDFRNTLGYLHDPHSPGGHNATATGGGGGGGGERGGERGGATGGGAGATSTSGHDEGIVYRSGFKIPLKEYQDSYKLKSMLSPQIHSNSNSLQPPQTNKLIGSKFARIRSVPTSTSSPSQGQGHGGGDYLIIEEDGRIDLTNDTVIQHANSGGAGGGTSGTYRPKTTEDRDKGVNSNFYKEMERRYIRPSSAPGKKHRQGVR